MHQKGGIDWSLAVSGALSFVVGAALLSLFATLQRLMLGVGVIPKGYIVPVLFGGSCGLIIGLAYIRLQRYTAELHNSRERYRILFSKGQDIMMVYEMTPDGGCGTCLESNEAARTRLGYPQGALRSLPHASICNPAMPHTSASMMALLRREGSAVFNANYRAADGSEIPVEVSAHLCELDGQPTIFTIARDITERLKAEEELQHYQSHLEELVAARTAALEEANDKLARLARLKDDFVANVSHELRTPIASLKLHHHLIASDPARQEVYLARLQREISRLESIIEDLLYLSRLDREQIAVDLQAVQLNDLVGVYVRDRIPLAGQRQLSITFEGQANLPVVQADARLVEQALSILVTNALNYTPAGGQVSVRTEMVDADGARWAAIQVRDTGPGVLDDEIPRLFERFYRGAVGRSSGMPGTGLGLAIAREIARRHNGQVKVNASYRPDKGALFEIWLPVEAQAATSSPAA